MWILMIVCNYLHWKVINMLNICWPVWQISPIFLKVWQIYLRYFRQCGRYSSEISDRVADTSPIFLTVWQIYLRYFWECDRYISDISDSVADISPIFLTVWQIYLRYFWQCGRYLQYFWQCSRYLRYFWQEIISIHPDTTISEIRNTEDQLNWIIFWK